MILDTSFQSPSLQPRQSGLPPAYEMKFVLTEDSASAVEAALRTRLVPDPYADPSRSNGYATTTLYCDTPELDIYHRRRGYARRKYRVRRYGLASTVFLERKAKVAERVRKRRAAISVSELEFLNSAGSDAVGDWTGGWFREQIVQKRLQPVLAVMYDRTAYVGTCENGPLRLTFDRAIRGAAVANWEVIPFAAGSGVLPGQVVCEFKFRGALPALFKAVIESQRLVPDRASKYRLCAEAAGISSRTNRCSFAAQGGAFDA